MVISRECRSNYARVARNADALALRLADFALGLELMIEETLRELSDSLIYDDVDPTPFRNRRFTEPL